MTTVAMETIECRYCSASWEYDADSQKEKDAALLERLLHERGEHGGFR